MKQQKAGILQLELKRGFGSVGFKIAIMIGFLAMMVDWNLTITTYLRAYPYSAESSSYWFLSVYENCFYMYTTFEGLEQYYYFVVPLLSALPFAISFHQDVHGGYIRNLLPRINKKDYLRSKYVSVFLTGGTAVTLPVVVNFLMTLLVLPLRKPLPEARLMNMFDGLFLKLHFVHPFLYMLFFWFILFLFAGLIATFSLLIAYFTDFTFMVFAFPFLLSLGGQIIGTSLGLEKWVPLYFVQATQVFRLSLMPIVLVLAGMAIISFVPYMIIGMKRELW